MERLSALDAGFLQLEDDHQHLHVGSLLLFEGPAPTFSELTEHVASCLDAIPRYRQRVQRMPLDLARPAWVDDQRFALSRHLRHSALAAPGDGDRLRALVGRVMSQRLDLDHPLWEMWLVEGLADGRWAMITKTHHAMVDGLAGSELLQILLGTSPEWVPAAAHADGWRPAPAPSRLELTASGIGGLARLPLDAVRVVAGGVRQGLASPGSLARGGVARAQGLTALARSVVAPTSTLNGRLGAQRRWGWARGDLAEVKAVRAAAGCSVNDVVLAAVAGGFREYLRTRDEDPDGTTIRSLVPVSVRTDEHRGRLGNHVTALVADLPVEVADPVERLAEAARRMHRLKTGGEAVSLESLLGAADLVPATVMALGARVYAATGQRVVNTVTTNVPGPQHPLYLLGRRLVELFPYIPVAEGVRISIGIVSYDGHLGIGLTGDRDAVPDLDVLCAAVEGSLAELVGLLASPR